MATDKSGKGRAALLAALALVKPALASAAYIPALTHVRFAGGWATAYNDVSAIQARADLGFDCCVPGDMLIRALGSFGGERVLVQETAGGLQISSGRSKVKMPTLKAEDFPFVLPSALGGIDMVAEVRQAIARCLISVGTNDRHPAQMGVTLEADAQGHAVLYSTDNYTISRCATKAKIKLPGGDLASPVILPTFFCEQLLALSKAFPDSADSSAVMYALPGALLAEFILGDDHVAARLFTRTLVDLEPLDFPRIVARHCDVGNVREDLAPIPDAFDAALGRALLVLAGEANKATKVTAGDGVLRLASTCAMGDADDSMAYEGILDPPPPFYADPAMLARASKVCAVMGFLPKAVCMADGDATFLHLIAHTGK